MKYMTSVAGREFNIEILDEGQVVVNGRSYQVDFASYHDQPIYSLLVDGRSYEAYVYPAEQAGWQVLLFGRSYLALVEDERERRLKASSGSEASERTEFHLKSPMPGLVVSIKVVENQPVEKGDVLVILESMKMQNELKSPRAGRVLRIRVQDGDRVDQHQTMLSVESGDVQ